MSAVWRCGGATAETATGSSGQAAVGRPRMDFIAWTAGDGQVPSFDAVAQKVRLQIKKRSFT